ncbi:MAG: prolyl oligopeptidase family serine peptidase, partial [candidate division Zixibacteria bacterium]|nr:S9 family peptidase [candidate division KSB1 bacterium]NIR64737.1 S9 family peptidase [candidate division Zixibacteria bacterium]NIW45523.1 prolyl oligopeptidase family serine peptidase [Gammaproteobacteria bacterium]NIS46568.1 S9 family peptidase [candidate division Zixibacteria bacterium]NIT71896.1 S9 family peptidase [candidate division KSB1 bacterium]
MQTSKSPKIAPYGSWKSPITANLIASGSIKFKDLQINDGNIYWLESRPGEKGRNAIMRRVGDNQPEQILPAPFNARSKVHEYGGGAFLAHQGSIYFTNYSDQRVYCLQASSDPVPLTEPADFRYADMEMDQRRQRLIAVEEDHSNPANEPLNMLVAIDLSKEGKTAKLVSGNDFYAFPRLSPDSSQLCWLTWNHPRMPWEGTELWVSNINRDGSLSEQKLLAGGPNESIFQPQWSPDGTLYFVSDRNNWWNIYRYQDDKIEPVIEMEAEFGLPQWVFNMSTYAFASAHQIICAYTKHGNWHLAEIDLTRKSLQTIETAYTTLDQIRAKNGKAVFCGASPTHPTSLVELDVSTKSTRVIRTTFELSFDRAYLSLPQTISFPTTNNQHAYGFLYSPRNPDYKTNENENPPLIVFIHGGPTGSTDTGLNLKIQYWTSRGFAVLDVNYRGSTGYGRAFRELLKGQSGIVDVSDCVHGA